MAATYNTYMGDCIYCGASAYYNKEEDETTFIRPAPGCLCRLAEAQCDYCISNMEKEESDGEHRDRC